MQIWFLIAAIVINLSLALVVFTRIRTATATAYFAISSLFIVFWALGTLAMLFAPTAELAYLGLIGFLLAPMATALYMVLFSKYFAEVEFPSGNKATIIFAIVMLGIAMYTILNLPSSNVIVSINQNAQNSINFQYPWFMVYGAYFSIIFLIAYIYLFVGLTKRKGRSKKQMMYVATGIFATSFLSLGTNILLPIVGNSSLVWLGPSWTIIYVIMTSFSMARHRLFDIRMALVLTFTYTLSLAALATMYFAIAFAVSSLLFKSQELSTGKGILDILLALVLAIVFQPVRNFFDRFTRNIFFRGSYNVDDFVARLGEKLNSTTDLRVLLENASKEISVTLKSHYVILIIHHSTRYISEGTKSHAHLPSDDVAQFDAYVDKHGDKPIISDSINKDDILHKILVAHRISIVIPLLRGDVKVGYLLLGDHLTGSYAKRDVKTLMTVRDELVIAIQNALSIQEVRELNDTLQQRVDFATKELRASNAQLQRLDKAKDEFVSMASHQLRTPLTSVKGYISMVLEGDVGKVSDAQKGLLSEAFTSSERMVHLINDFLNVSRLQTGKFLIEKKPVDLAKVVEQELDSLSTNAKSRNLSFEYKKPKDIPILDLDEDKMRQVIMNFADNAIYYSIVRSKIKVDLSTSGNEVIFTVKDTGIGVPRAEQSQLFNKFYRASNARKQRPDGTGVGLFLAKKVIDSHGGEVVFESKEGEGSTFGFKLPIDELKSSSDLNNPDNHNDNKGNDTAGN